jgi:hypothetical protein
MADSDRIDEFGAPELIPEPIPPKDELDKIQNELIQLNRVAMARLLEVEHICTDLSKWIQGIKFPKSIPKDAAIQASSQIVLSGSSTSVSLPFPTSAKQSSAFNQTQPKGRTSHTSSIGDATSPNSSGIKRDLNEALRGSTGSAIPEAKRKRLGALLFISLFEMPQ